MIPPIPEWPTVAQLADFDSVGLDELALTLASHHSVFISSATNYQLKDHAIRQHAYGLRLSETGKRTRRGNLNRLQSYTFWRRHLRRVADQAREEIAAQRGLIGPRVLGKSPYCTDESVKHFLSRQEVRTGGSTQKLQEGFAKAAHQGYMIAKANAESAYEAGFWSMFITVTCPPRFHSSSPDYDKSSFNDAHAWLSTFTHRLINHLARKAQIGTEFFGTRVLEVHSDGCPHFHILLYGTPVIAGITEARLDQLYQRESGEVFEHYLANKGKVFQCRNPDNLKTFSEAVSYVFKNSYAGRKDSSVPFDDAMRQKIAICCSGKRQYQHFGTNGNATKLLNLRRLSKQNTVGGEADSLIVSVNVLNRRRIQLDAVKSLLTGGMIRYQFFNKVYRNQYGETSQSIDSVMYGQDLTRNSDAATVNNMNTREIYETFIKVFLSAFACYVVVICNDSRKTSIPAAYHETQYRKLQRWDRPILARAP